MWGLQRVNPAVKQVFTNKINTIVDGDDDFSIAEYNDLSGFITRFEAANFENPEEAPFHQYLEKLGTGEYKKEGLRLLEYVFNKQHLPDPEMLSGLATQAFKDNWVGGADRDFLTLTAQFTEQQDQPQLASLVSSLAIGEIYPSFENPTQMLKILFNAPQAQVDGAVMGQILDVAGGNYLTTNERNILGFAAKKFDEQNGTQLASLVSSLEIGEIYPSFENPTQMLKILFNAPQAQVNGPVMAALLDQAAAKVQDAAYDTYLTSNERNILSFAAKAFDQQNNTQFAQFIQMLQHGKTYSVDSQFNLLKILFNAPQEVDAATLEKLLQQPGEHRTITSSKDLYLIEKAILSHVIQQFDAANDTPLKLMPTFQSDHDDSLDLTLGALRRIHNKRSLDNN